MKKLLGIALIAGCAFAAEGYKLLDKWKVGGTGGWDYLTLDQASRRLFASHGNQVEVIDADKGTKIGVIPDTQGVHGIAVANDLGKAFITAGRTSSLIVVDLKTFEKTGEAKTGANPDSVCYEPKTQRAFVFNNGATTATVIDAKTLQTIATIEVGEGPEFCQVDGAGHVYANISETSEVVEIDAAKPAVTRRAALKPVEDPSGLAIDVKGQKLFSVGANKMMAVTDIATMKVIATPAVGAGTDGAGFDTELGLAFSSNGGDGTLTIVKLVNGKYEAVDTVPTARGGRTMFVDQKLHKVYIPTAEYGAPEGQKRPAALPDTFQILVIGK